MSANKLIHILTPRQITHLAAGVHMVELVPIGRVPEPDAAVRRASARHQKVALVGRPCNCFHCRRVLRQSMEWLCRVLIPHQKLVVVSTRR